MRLKLRHHGPGPHKNGSPQSVHGKGTKAKWAEAQAGDGASFLRAALVGHVTKAEPLDLGGINEPEFIALEGDGNAVWKEAKQGMAFTLRGGTPADMEVAAYELSRLFGFQHIVVPETVYLRKEGKLGSAQRFVADGVDGGRIEDGERLARRLTDVEWTEITFLDTIIGNSDRASNRGNLVFGERGKGRVYAIDHGYAYPATQRQVKAVPSYMRPTIMKLTAADVRRVLPRVADHLRENIWGSIVKAQEGIAAGTVAETMPPAGVWA